MQQIEIKWTALRISVEHFEQTQLDSDKPFSVKGECKVLSRVEVEGKKKNVFSCGLYLLSQSVCFAKMCQNVCPWL